MEHRSILCPIDFSDASRGALRYAALIARHLNAELVVATVTDTLLTEAAELTASVAQLPDAIRQELSRFCQETFEDAEAARDVRFEVATGKPAVEILRLAREQSVSAIVMSTHGLTGMRKLFFGSTTERVLRETTVPIVLTPGHDHGPFEIDDVKQRIRRVLVPVDLTAATDDQVMAASEIATVVDVPVLLAHVVEPVRVAVSGFPHLPNVELERRSRAERALSDLVARVPARLHPEALVAYGDPAEEIAKIARDRHVGLIVIGLHASAVHGPRMGSVTYRVLCLTSSLVLAFPPRMTAKPSQASASAGASSVSVIPIL
jgi:nucleotide-binding universal stress UspA family protein